MKMETMPAGGETTTRLGATVPPSAATPPGLGFRSGVAAPFTGFPLDSAAISVAADGTLWLAVDSPGPGTSALLVYDFGQAETRQVHAGSGEQIDSLAAVSATSAYVVVSEAHGAWVGAYRAGRLDRLPPLPGGAVPAQVAAASDDTVWILDAGGAPYVLTGDVATPVPAPKGGLAAISVGSADHVLALGAASGAGSTNTLTWSSAGGWAPYLERVQATWLAACADGSAWVLTDTVLSVSLPDGTLRSMDVSSIVDPVSWTAASRMSAYALGLVGAEVGVTPVTLGVLDLPPTPWPAMTAGQQAAYRALSDALGVVAPGGVRAEYTNALEPFSDWYTRVITMATPDGVGAADWKVVQAQIGAELLYLQAVYNLFSELATLTGFVATIQSDQLQGVAAEVGLTQQSEGASEVTVLLGALTTTLVTRLGTLFPPPYGLAVSLVGSGLMAAAQYTAQKYNPGDSTERLTVAYAHLAEALAGNLAQAVTEQESEQTAILTDWGRLSATGQAIAQGVWSWPVGLTGKSLVGIVPVLQLYFFQALMPARWQILRGEIVYTPRLPSPDPKAPAHAVMFKSVTDAQYDVLDWFYVCCGLGSEADIVQNSGPYPAAQLMSDIFELGVEPADFFGGAGGWTLPVADSPGWADPPQAVPWQPYAGPT